MSKNVAPVLPKLVALIVFSAVVPDWECKSGSLFFNMQETDAKNCKKTFRLFNNRLITRNYRPVNFSQIFEVLDHMHLQKRFLLQKIPRRQGPFQLVMRPAVLVDIFKTVIGRQA